MFHSKVSDWMFFKRFEGKIPQDKIPQTKSLQTKVYTDRGLHGKNSHGQTPTPKPTNNKAHMNTAYKKLLQKANEAFLMRAVFVRAFYMGTFVHVGFCLHRPLWELLYIWSLVCDGDRWAFVMRAFVCVCPQDIYPVTILKDNLNGEHIFYCFFINIFFADTWNVRNKIIKKKQKLSFYAWFFSLKLQKNRKQNLKPNLKCTEKTLSFILFVLLMYESFYFLENRKRKK